MIVTMVDKDGVFQARHINPKNYHDYIKRMAWYCVEKETREGKQCQ